MSQAAETTLTSRQRYWLAHLQACAASGKTIAAYAMEQGLQAKTMYAGKKALVNKGVLPHTRSPRFQRAQVSEPVVNSDWRIQLPNGVSVAFTDPMDARTLGTVLNTAAAIE